MLNIKKITQSVTLGLFISGAVGASPAFANLSHHAHTLNGRDVVAYNGDAAPGSIVIHVNERRLYYVVGDGSAISYPVAVPKSGKEWSGVTSISAKQENPDWSPPADVRADHPELPEVIPGGAPNNPMRTRAMLLEKGEVAIHEEQRLTGGRGVDAPVAVGLHGGRIERGEELHRHAPPLLQP